MKLNGNYYGNNWTIIINRTEQKGKQKLLTEKKFGREFKAVLFARFCGNLPLPQKIVSNLIMK